MSKPVLHENELGPPIATRELGRVGQSEPIVVRIWAPRHEETGFDGGTWGCPYQIMGFGDERIRLAYGEDAIQAIQLSFSAIRAHLQPKANGVYWIDAELADAGFPREVTYVLGADFYDYLCELIDGEIEPDPDDFEAANRIRKARVAAWKSARNAKS